MLSENKYTNAISNMVLDLNMLHDYENIENDTVLEADICIIGSGVAGLSIANEFIDTPYKVIVLEGGGKKDESRSQKLYHSDVAGMPHDGIHNGRFRVYGGSSTRWGAQLMTMTPNDYSQRGYISNSGWPIDDSVISKFYARARAILKVDDLSFEHDLWKSLELTPIPFSKEKFRYRFSKWASFKNRNLAKTLGPQCEASGNVSIYLHANVTEIVPVESGSHISEVKVSSFSGKSGLVRAKQFILCSGAIEVARLMLASRSVIPAGVGNQNYLVGRYFQDHISVRAGQLLPADRRVFAGTFDPFFRGDTMHSPKLVMDESLQQELKCLNVMGHIVFGFTEESGLYELRRILRAMQAKKNPLPSPMGAWRILRYSHDIARLFLGQKLARRKLSPKFAKCYLEVECEQAPNPQSRVMISDELDELGVPKTILDWKITDQEKFTVEKYIEAFTSEWKLLGLGDVKLTKDLFSDDKVWSESCRDTYHHAGTTRMSNDPALGVVDENMKVHGIDNLYIGSCSVFPTSGCANPTFTMMALCLRLADRLKTIVLK